MDTAPHLTDVARATLLESSTRMLVTCGDPRCIHSLITWEADVPGVSVNRGWPQCPEKHRISLCKPFYE
jgi:hypothetical protein